MQSELLLILMLSVLVPSLSLFVRKCFEPGMIFRRYFVLLNYFWIRWRKLPMRKYRGLLKPAGLCIYCYNTWLTIITGVLAGLSPLSLLLTLGSSYIVLELFQKLTHK